MQHKGRNALRASAPSRNGLTVDDRPAAQKLLDPSSVPASVLVLVVGCVKGELP